MSDTSPNPLYTALVRYYAVEPTSKGVVHVPCPRCRKAPKPKQTHFSFCEDGGYCFVCGFGANLYNLSQLVLGDTVDTSGYVPTPKAPPEPMQWQSCADVVLASLHHEPGALRAWQSYRPFTQATFDRWQLGLGRLWFRNDKGKEFQSSHSRLVYPIIVNEQIIGFRGRAIHPDDHGAKWINATNSQMALIGLDLVTTGSTVVLCESPVDAMLAMQVNPRIVAIAGTAGAGTWRHEWTAELTRRKPKRIILWYDHDFAGNCPIGGKHYQRCDVCQAEYAKWQQEHPDAKAAPKSNAPKLYQELKRIGCNVDVYQWPLNTPPKADLGWALMNKG